MSSELSQVQKTGETILKESQQRINVIEGVVCRGAIESLSLQA